MRPSFISGRGSGYPPYSSPPPELPSSAWLPAPSPPPVPARAAEQGRSAQPYEDAPLSAAQLALIILIVDLRYVAM